MSSDIFTAFKQLRIDSGDDRNDNSPPVYAFGRLHAQAAVAKRETMERAAPFQRVAAASIGKWANRRGIKRLQRID
jgi:hypothetical protein